MKKPITTLPEAEQVLRDATEDVQRLLAFMGDYCGILAQMKAMTGIAPMPVLAPEFRPVLRPLFTPVPLEKMAMTDRVLLLYKEIGEPMMPKDAVAQYQQRNWPLPKKGKPYDAITAAITYLSRKGRLVRVESGYAYVHELEPQSDLLAASQNGHKKEITLDDI